MTLGEKAATLALTFVAALGMFVLICFAALVLWVWLVL